MDVGTIIKYTSGEGKAIEVKCKPSKVEVKEQLKQLITFTITYSEDICDGDFALISGDVFDPLTDVEIWVEADKIKTCLIKGVVMSQQITLVNGGQGSELQVTGSDNSCRLGWTAETRNWGKQMKPHDFVDLLSFVENKPKKKKPSKKKAYKGFDLFHIMGKYYKNGVEIDKKTQKSNRVIIEDKEEEERNKLSEVEDTDELLKFPKAQMQRGDDLSFIRSLADQKGYYFWVSYEDDTEIINFNKLPLVDFDQQAYLSNDDYLTLVINQEGNNIDQFSISWDAERATAVESYYLDIITADSKKSEETAAPQPKLGNITLSELTSDALTAYMMVTIGDDKTPKERNEAALNDAEWFIKANCTTTYDRLCKLNKGIIRAHTMVMVSGAGSRHSGMYLVSGVTHTIDESTYKMDIQLMRNAWLGIEIET